jgi:hypothetical protein
MAEKWYCSKCGTPFTRRYSAERHISYFHPGQATPVREYQKDSTMQQPLNSFYQDNMYSPFYATPRKSSALYPSPKDGKNSRHGDLGREKAGVDFWAEKMTERIWQTLQDRVENITVDYILRQQHWSSPGTPMLPSWPSHMPAQYQSSLGDVFGYVSHACDKCQMWEPLEVYFSTGPDRTTQRGHQCHNKLIEFKDWNVALPAIFRNARMMQNTDTPCLFFEEFLIRKWAENNDPLQLAAFKVNDPDQGQVPEGSEKGTGNSRLIVSLPHPTKAKEQHVILSCDRNECAGLIRPEAPTHWINRVISDGTTYIRTKEFEEFLPIARDATFAFVRVHANHRAEQTGQEHGSATSSDEYYLIALTDKDWNQRAKLLRSMYNKVNAL